MRRPWWQWVIGWLGAAAFAGTLVLYAAGGLLAPAWAIALLLLAWLALLWLVVRLMRTGRPLWVPAVPVAAYTLWYAALTAGERWLGWTG
ncbi:hypothetical protein [Paractinoplanes deccanensis]|uniref:hypothetical protein n=1 Tax=Paractinoplanes deccanensis TaxID=113561 RepID=UPI001943DF88|nr:hypothetical protein [Actinoplanes deccanensis]